MKWWLCMEHGEYFILQAMDRPEAHASASLYGGHVVRELDEDEVIQKTLKSGDIVYAYHGA